MKVIKKREICEYIKAEFRAFTEAPQKKFRKNVEGDPVEFSEEHPVYLRRNYGKIFLRSYGIKSERSSGKNY